MAFYHVDRFTVVRIEWRIHCALQPTQRQESGCCSETKRQYLNVWSDSNQVMIFLPQSIDYIIK
jgi:hypothetical protein